MHGPGAIGTLRKSADDDQAKFAPIRGGKFGIEELLHLKTERRSGWRFFDLGSLKMVTPGNRQCQIRSLYFFILFARPRLWYPLPGQWSAMLVKQPPRVSHPIRGIVLGTW